MATTTRRKASVWPKLGLTRAASVRRILATWEQATPEDIEHGQQWYATSFELAVELAAIGDTTIERAAIVIAHLSPRTSWSKNVTAAYSLMRTGDAPGMIATHVERARAALVADDPWSTFGKAPKTRAFAANILGDPHAVTVDVWATLIATGTKTAPLHLVGAYDAVAGAYIAAARVAGVPPSVMQATTWVVARGRHA